MVLPSSMNRQLAWPWKLVSTMHGTCRSVSGVLGMPCSLISDGDATQMTLMSAIFRAISEESERFEMRSATSMPSSTRST